MVGHTQDLTKLSVIPIELLLICIHYQFRIPVVTQTSGWLLILYPVMGRLEALPRLEAVFSPSWFWGLMSWSWDLVSWLWRLPSWSCPHMVPSLYHQRRDFQLKMHHKAFGGWTLLPGPTGELPDLLAGFRGMAPQGKGKEGKGHPHLCQWIAGIVKLIRDIFYMQWQFYCL